MKLERIKKIMDDVDMPKAESFISALQQEALKKQCAAPNGKRYLIPKTETQTEKSNTERLNIVLKDGNTIVANIEKDKIKSLFATLASGDSYFQSNLFLAPETVVACYVDNDCIR